MARLNIEDSIFTERGWLDLVIELQDADKALGALVRAWSVAQKFWKDSDLGIPKSEWKKQRLNDAIIGKLADDNGDFILMHGSAKQFAWLRQKVEAGRNGGKTPKKAKLEIIDESLKRSIAERIEDQRSEPSYSSSSSFSLSSSSSNSPSGCEIEKAPRKARAAPKSETSEIWESYRKAYLQRHKVEPTRNARVNGQLASYAKRVPLDEAPAIAAFYVRHNRAFYVQKSHPVGLLLQDAESLRTEWLNGRAVLTSDARDAERKQNTYNAFAKHIQGDSDDETK